MTRQEFEERTGCKLTEEAYAPIEAMYLAAGEMDKDEFCRQWAKHGDCALVQELMNRIRNLERDKRLYRETTRSSSELLKQGAQALIRASYEVSDERLILLAKRMTSNQWVIVEKAKIGIKLTESEIEYLEENLQ